jgi:predicted GH43/DUF377 family glycosyl hydrolase
MTPFKMHRMGMIMEPKPGEAAEVEGVLNPAATRGPDGQLYLFPRLVGQGNFSRIGIARVLFDKAGDPVGVERMGYALEPQADFELAGDGRGGCEDARVTYVDTLGYYVMTYTALGAQGPRIALARSKDLVSWERVGLARFTPFEGIAFEGVANKDASVFSQLIKDPNDRPSVAMLHRPLFAGTRPEEKVEDPHCREPDLNLESIWISYWHLGDEIHHTSGRSFVAHRRLARPEADWEKLKIGAGAPPMLCRHGWLMVYHGVHEEPGSTPERRNIAYSAGVMILSKDHPHEILYRSPQPVLEPEDPMELQGTVNGVVFPTGLDRRDDLGQPDRFDVYYGMADDRIGVARMTAPDALPGADARPAKPIP